MAKKFLYDIGVRGAKNAENQLRGIDNTLKNMIKTSITLAGSIVGIKKAFEVSRFGAEFKNVERAFGNISASADIMLFNIRKATAGTISDFQLMQKYNTAALLGLPLDQFDQMLQIARGAAQATGQSMEWMLDSIVTGIGRQSKLMLDNLGILISAEVANIKYAKAIGKSASQLTDFERKQAFANEAIRIGNENLEKTGGVVDTSIDSYDRAKSSFVNLKTEIGELIDPVLSKAAEATGGFFTMIANDLKRIQGTLPELDSLNESLAYAQRQVNMYQSQLERATRKGRHPLLAWLGNAELAESEVVKWQSVIDILTSEINKLIEDGKKLEQQKILEERAKQEAARIKQLKENVNILSNELQKFHDNLMWGLESQTLWADELEIIERRIQDIVPSFGSLDDIIKQMHPENQLLLNTMTGVGNAMAQAAIYSQELGQAFVSAIKSMVAQLASSALLFGFLEMLLPGKAVLGGGRGLINFLGGGGLNLSTSSNNSAPKVPNQNFFLIIDDESGTQLQKKLDKINANA